jgi:hypothetical protein
MPESNTVVHLPKTATAHPPYGKPKTRRKAGGSKADQYIYKRPTGWQVKIRITGFHAAIAYDRISGRDSTNH